MTERRRLTEQEIDVSLARVHGWTLVAGKLHRELTFPSFVEAFGFMSAVALVAESMNHHPAWRNVYDQVAIDLSTHDVGGISALDFELAEKIGRLAEKLQ